MNHTDEWLAEKSADPRSNDEIFRELYTLPEESDEECEAYTVLQARRDPAIIARAIEMCRSADARTRLIGAGVLSQNGSCGRQVMKEESVGVLVDLVLNDDDPEVLAMAAIALDDYADERISPALARLIDHPDEDVRYEVVMGLLCREDEIAVRSMISLSGDEDGDVRNWATFGLAQQIDTDTPEVREALLARVHDPVAEVRGEALLGLANRHDERVIEPLIDELHGMAEADDYWDMVFEAAAKMADPRLCPALSALADDEIENEYYREALKACGGDSSDRAPDAP